MKRARLVLTLSLAVGSLVLAGGGFIAGRLSQGSPTGTARAVAAAHNAVSAPRKVLYWHDPMVPGPRFDKPGKSPFMDMQLEPVYADEGSNTDGDTGVRIRPAIQQNLGIRTATVRRQQAAASIEAVGTVQFDERLSQAVQTRVAGYVEHLAVRAPMERVRQGQALATLFAPDWLGPQNELLALEKAGGAPDIVAAARERLRAMSIPDALIRQSEAAGTAQARVTLTAPISGVVAELGVRDGVAVSPGTTLYRLAGLDKVWAVADVPESQAAQLRPGQTVTAVLQADASQTFAGALAEILPQINAGTRTLQARFEVDNRRGKLVPGMLLRLQLAGPVASRLVVPAEAVIRTGARAVSIVRTSGGGFEPREVQLGVDLGDQIEVVRGLAEGDEVITSGQFLIDSEARLKSVTDSMAASGGAR
ncbi:MAG: efflux RND transporter periplasmic adaptor subunit [Burkholderiaceae bacterium]|nr:efflux RND transporter periplasmic adaptor subunit [Burkholderiaceae bacterium]